MSDEYLPPLEESAAFIKEIDPTKPLPVDIEALQALKFESEDPTEAALSLKEEGNYNFKKRQYQEARDNYSAAIGCKPPDTELLTSLLTNRAAAEFRLGNYGSCQRDCARAKSLSPSNYKANLRGAQALLALEKLAECQVWCDEALLLFPGDAELLRLSAKALAAERLLEAKRRRGEADRRRRRDADAEVEAAVAARGIRRRVGSERIDVPADMRLRLSDDRRLLLLPLLLLYPEFGETDALQDVREDSTVGQVAATVFGGGQAAAAAWNSDGLYGEDSAAFFVDDADDGCYRRVARDATVGDLLTRGGARLTGSVLVLTVVSPESPKFYSGWLAANRVLGC